MVTGGEQPARGADLMSEKFQIWREKHCCDCVFIDNNACRRYPPKLLPWHLGDGEHIDVWQYPNVGGGQLACGEFIAAERGHHD